MSWTLSSFGSVAVRNFPDFRASISGQLDLSVTSGTITNNELLISITLSFSINRTAGNEGTGADVRLIDPGSPLGLPFININGSGRYSTTSYFDSDTSAVGAVISRATIFSGSPIRNKNDAKGEYELSNVTVEVVTGPIPAITLTAAAISDTQINTAWTDVFSDETSWHVERALDEVSFSEIASLGASVAAHQSTGLASSTKYFFRVRAQIPAGFTPYSNIAEATTSSPPGGPPPSGVAPAVTATSPANRASDVSLSVSPTITFSTGSVSSMDGATVTTSTVFLTQQGVVVPATVSLAGGNTVTIDPTSDLVSGNYLGTVVGGASGVKNAAAVAMPSTYTWSFSTGTPPPPPPPPKDVLKVSWHETLLRDTLYDTNYPITIAAKDSVTGATVTSVKGTAHLFMKVNGVTRPGGEFTVNGVSSAETTLASAVKFVNGIAPCTLRFPTTAPVMLTASLMYMSIVKLPADTLTLGGGYTNPSPDAITPPSLMGGGPGLEFTAQPPANDEVGHVFTTPVKVTVFSAPNVVNTVWGGDIVLTMKDVAGTDATSLLIGTKTTTPVLGVATYPALYIAKVGFYTLFATSTVGTVILSGVSTGITITGDDGEQALRQNLRDDNTVWVRTTNITSPTFATFTDAEKSTLDGDEAVTANVTFDGTRWKFPFTIKSTLVRFKVAVSTLASNPTIQLYSSQNTTTGQDGTWSLVSSITPTTTGVFIAQFAFGSPIFAKGLWLTLNDMGGAATANWYSQQVMGKYLGTSLSFLGVEASEMATENYVGIPQPFATIGGATTKFRSFQVRNNTAAEMSLFAVPTPARSTGDTLMDADNFFVMDGVGNNISSGFKLPAYASKLLQLRYSIGEAENDKSKEHYERLTFSDVSQNDSYLVYMDNNAGGASIRRVIKISNGVMLTSQSTGAAVMYGHFTVPSSQAWAVSSFNASDAMVIRNNQGTNHVAPLNNPVTLTINTWSAGDEDSISGIGVADDKMLIALSTSLSLVIPPQSAANFTTLTIVRADCSTFAIPAQTTGAKRFQQGPAGTLYLSNGTATGSVIYQMSSTAILNTINPTTPFGGRGIASFFYDSFNSELNIISTLSAGSRVVARYNSSGTFITSVSTTTESTLEASGAFVILPSIYIVYGVALLYKHDIQTWANAALVSTLESGDNPGDSRLFN